MREPIQIQLKVSDLYQYSPQRMPVWACTWSPFTAKEINEVIRRGGAEPERFSYPSQDSANYMWDRETHVRRVAFFVQSHPDWDPILLKDCGRAKWWPIEDGHHRLGAAVHLGLEWIDCLFPGSTRELEAMFKEYKLCWG